MYLDAIRSRSSAKDATARPEAYSNTNDSISIDLTKPQFVAITEIQA